MLSEQTHQKLVEMRLYGLAASFDEYLTERNHEKLSFDERFGLMVDREFNDRLQKRTRRKLTSAKLREPACMEDIDYRHPRQLDRSVMQRLALGNWINKENILITGSTGVGKTWLGCALANQACRLGYTAIYQRVPRLIHALQLAKADGSYVKELTRLAKVDVLILDDLVGVAPLGDAERRDLLEIIEDRYINRSTIATSQLAIKKWHDTIGDPTIADALLDRLVHRAHRIELRGVRSLRDTTTKTKTGSTGAKNKKKD